MQTQTNGQDVTARIPATAVSSTGSPYHETLLDTLRAVKKLGEAELIGDQIIATKIPKEHGHILRAWNEMCERIGYADDRVVRKLEALVTSTSADD